MNSEPSGAYDASAAAEAAAEDAADGAAADGPAADAATDGAAEFVLEPLHAARKAAAADIVLAYRNPRRLSGARYIRWMTRSIALLSTCAPPPGEPGPAFLSLRG